MNPFTDESRDARLKVDIDGLCTTLRAPASIHRLLMDCKPAGVAVGDFALTSMLNDVITACMVRRDYRAIQRLLGTLFGVEVPPGTDLVAPPRKPPVAVPSGTPGAIRHQKVS